MDRFQKRYIKHQENKKKELETKKNTELKEYKDGIVKDLIDIMVYRKSRRIFKRKISINEIDFIIKTGETAPSSCNRHGIEIKEAPKKLIPLLIGGKGWCDKATVLAFYADMKCYKSEYEKGFMPYLDTGFIAQNIYLICEAKGLKCCFINPNTHNKYKSKKLLCGAMAIGK